MKRFLLLLCILLNLFAPAKDRIHIAQPELERKDKEAVLILTGFGSKVHGTKEIASCFFEGDKDVFMPHYISRKSISACVENLNDFIEENHLGDYKKIHVFAYIIGSWTLNEWIAQHPGNNIASIIYDRSPLQERVPFALVEDIPFLMRFISGPIMKEFAETSYTPMKDTSITVGILIESKATKLFYNHKNTALEMGIVYWETDSLHQPYHDFTYIYMNHDDMYTEIEKISSEVWHFISNGKFSTEARREKFTENPYKEFEK